MGLRPLTFYGIYVILPFKSNPGPTNYVFLNGPFYI
jgi:hypothetical protein